MSKNNKMKREQEPKLKVISTTLSSHVQFLTELFIFLQTLILKGYHKSISIFSNINTLFAGEYRQGKSHRENTIGSLLLQEVWRYVEILK